MDKKSGLRWTEILMQSRISRMETDFIDLAFMSFAIFVVLGFAEEITRADHEFSDDAKI